MRKIVLLFFFFICLIVLGRNAPRFLDKQTGLLSSHSSDEILERHYIDPTVLTAAEKAILKLRVFG